LGLPNQKTSLIDGGFSRLICCAASPSLHDVRLNPNSAASVIILMEAGVLV
jgi:hypothetical protein